MMGINIESGIFRLDSEGRIDTVLLDVSFRKKCLKVSSKCIFQYGNFAGFIKDPKLYKAMRKKQFLKMSNVFWFWWKPSNMATAVQYGVRLFVPGHSWDSPAAEVRPFLSLRLLFFWISLMDERLRSVRPPGPPSGIPHPSPSSTLFFFG